MDRLLAWRKWIILGAAGVTLVSVLAVAAVWAQGARAVRLPVAGGWRADQFSASVASLGQAASLGCCAPGSKTPMIGCGASRAPSTSSGATATAEQAARERWLSAGGDPSATFKAIDYGCHTGVQVIVGGQVVKNYSYLPGIGIVDS